PGRSTLGRRGCDARRGGRRASTARSAPPCRATPKEDWRAATRGPRREMRARRRSTRGPWAGALWSNCDWHPSRVVMSLKALLDLGGRTALVTGGSRGLGLQIAEALCEQGARVALVARKDDELASARKHLADTLGADAITLPCDLSSAAAIAPMVERAQQALGPIDILVNNAGATWG